MGWWGREAQVHGFPYGDLSSFACVGVVGMVEVYDVRGLVMGCSGGSEKCLVVGVIGVGVWVSPASVRDYDGVLRVFRCVGGFGLCWVLVVLLCVSCWMLGVF